MDYLNAVQAMNLASVVALLMVDLEAVVSDYRSTLSYEHYICVLDVQKSIKCVSVHPKVQCCVTTSMWHMKAFFILQTQYTV